MATMPNVVGLCLQDAQTALSNAGVLNTGSIGYFGTWPISVSWKTNTPFDFVTAQVPTSGTTNVAANSAVILTVNNPKLGVVYP